MRETTTKLTLREKQFKTLFFIALHLLVLGILVYQPNLMISTILAFVIYYLMEPFVEYLEFKGLSRTLASSIPFLAFGLLVVGIILWLFPLLLNQIEALKSQWPQYSMRIKELILQVETNSYPWLKDISQNSILDSTQNYLLTKASAFFGQIPTLLSSSLTIMLLTPFFAFFLLYEGNALYRRFMMIVPNHLFELMINVNHSINLQMGQFIRARLLETALIALFIFIFLSLIHFPYSLIFAISAGVLNLIPYVGPVIALIPQLALCFISPELKNELLPILAINMGAQIFDAALLVPLLVAKIVDLHPIVVVLAVILGGQLLGVLGMIISIPLASAIKVFITAFYKYMTHTR